MRVFIQTFVKWIWAGSRCLVSSAKLGFFWALTGSYFKKVGAGTRFFGRVRFGTVEGNISVGRKCMIGHDVFLSAGKKCEIVVGDFSSLNSGCHVVALFGIRIGSHTHIGEYCSIRDQDHAFSALDVPIDQQGYTGEPIVIGNNVWIGRGVHICPGVTIGDGAVIGANSVVKHNIASNAIAVGAPARTIRHREAARASQVD